VVVVLGVLSLVVVGVTVVMELIGEVAEAVVSVDGVPDLWRLRVRGRVDPADAGRFVGDAAAGGTWALGFGLLWGLSLGVESVDEGVAGEFRPLTVS
jgi:hypothetical protein